MAVDPFLLTRILTKGFGGAQVDTAVLRQGLQRSAQELARMGLIHQDQALLTVAPGQKQLTLAPRWLASFALLIGNFSSCLPLKDQTGKQWWVSVDLLGNFQVSDTQPAGVPFGQALQLSFLQWQSPDTTTWYLLPDDQGHLISTTIPPSGNGTTEQVIWRSALLEEWEGKVDNSGTLFTERVT